MPLGLLSRLAAVVLVLSLASAGCATVDALNGPTGDPTLAAQVNDERIPITALEERVAVAEQSPSIQQRLAEDPEGTERAAIQIELLSELVLGKILESAAGEVGVSVGEAEIARQRQQFEEQAGGPEQLQAALEQQGIGPDEFRAQIRLFALQTAIGEAVQERVEVTDAELREFYESPAGPYGPQSASIRQAVLPTPAEAEDALARIEAGDATFAEIAAEAGAGPPSEPLELPRGQAPPNVESLIYAAEAGEVVGPVDTSQGSALIEVVELGEPAEAPPFREVQQELREQLVSIRQQTVVQEFFETTLGEAEVQVNPRFGRWDADAQQVVPSSPLGDIEAPSEEGASELPPLPGS